MVYNFILLFFSLPLKPCCDCCGPLHLIKKEKKATGIGDNSCFSAVVAGDQMGYPKVCNITQRLACKQQTRL